MEHRIYAGDRPSLGKPPCDGRVSERFRPIPDTRPLRQRLLERVRYACDLPAGHDGRHQRSWCGCPEWNFAIERCECSGSCGCY